jgi:D-sedoheptulose 7-phosphate isomerase
MSQEIKNSFLESLDVLTNFCNDNSNFEKVSTIALLLQNTFNNNYKVIIAGNGGSACDSMHFAEEFTGRFRKDRKPLPVITLTDASHITCVGNDYGIQDIFSRGVNAFGQKNDVFIGISTSGNSQNIINAVNAAKRKELKTIAFLGKDGGKLKGMCDFEFIIPGKTADKIQELHMTILHILIEGTERLMFPNNYI